MIRIVLIVNASSAVCFVCSDGKSKRLNTRIIFRSTHSKHMCRMCKPSWKLSNANNSYFVWNIWECVFWQDTEQIRTQQDTKCNRQVSNERKHTDKARHSSHYRKNEQWRLWIKIEFEGTMTECSVYDVWYSCLYRYLSVDEPPQRLFSMEFRAALYICTS